SGFQGERMIVEFRDPNHPEPWPVTEVPCESDPEHFAIKLVMAAYPELEDPEEYMQYCYADGSPLRAQEIERTCGGCGRRFSESPELPVAERGRCPHCVRKPPLGMVPYMPTHNHQPEVPCVQGCPTWDWAAYMQ